METNYKFLNMHFCVVTLIVLFKYFRIQKHWVGVLPYGILPHDTFIYSKGNKSTIKYTFACTYIYMCIYIQNNFFL